MLILRLIFGLLALGLTFSRAGWQQHAKSFQLLVLGKWRINLRSSTNLFHVIRNSRADWRRMGPWAWRNDGERNVRVQKETDDIGQHLYSPRGKSTEEVVWRHEVAWTWPFAPFLFLLDGGRSRKGARRGSSARAGGLHRVWTPIVHAVKLTTLSLSLSLSEGFSSVKTPPILTPSHKW